MRYFRTSWIRWNFGVFSGYAKFLFLPLQMCRMVSFIQEKAYFIYMRQEVQDKAFSSQINRLSRIADQHENYLASMLDSAVQMGLSPAIKAFVHQDEPAKAYELQQQLAPYTVTNSFCDQIYVIFHGDDHIYSSTSSMTLEDFLSITHYEHITPEELSTLIRNPDALTILPAQMVGSPLISASQTSVISFLTPLGINPAASKGMLLFMVSNQVYRQLFADAVEVADNTYIIQDGRILVSQRDFEISDDLVLSGSQKANMPQTLTWNGEKWYLLCQRSDVWDLEYVSLMRMADVDHIVWSRMLSFIILGAVLAAIGVLAAFLLAQRHDAPIRQIALAMSNTPFTAARRCSLAALTGWWTRIRQRCGSSAVTTNQTQTPYPR